MPRTINSNSTSYAENIIQITNQTVSGNETLPIQNLGNKQEQLQKKLKRENSYLDIRTSSCQSTLNNTISGLRIVISCGNLSIRLINHILAR